MNRPSAGPTAWYLRRGDQVSGPFPHGLMVRYRELGRLKVSDEVSADGVNWFRVDEVPALAFAPIDDTDTSGAVEVEGEVNWDRERGRARRRWLEERWIPDRRSGGDGAAGTGQARGPDRRKDPNARETVHFASDRAPPVSRTTTVTVAFAVVIAVVLAGFAVWRLAPSKELKVVLMKPPASDCAAAAAPGVRWTGCDKRGAALAGAALAGADLRNTILSGADLARSRLDGANLSNADLRGADLEGASLADAELSGARLDEARWIDGRLCERGSVGHCAGAPR